MAEKQTPPPEHNRATRRAFASWWHDAFVPLVVDAFFPLLFLLILLLGSVVVAVFLLRSEP